MFTGSVCFEYKHSYISGCQGDLQMCVTVLLALKDVGKNMIEFSIQEEWFNGYLGKFVISTLLVDSIISKLLLVDSMSTVFSCECCSFIKN